MTGRRHGHRRQPGMRSRRSPGRQAGTRPGGACPCPSVMASGSAHPGEDHSKCIKELRRVNQESRVRSDGIHIFNQVDNLESDG
jgi:hypothetical protein